ncbi:MAG: hypothetical protein AB8G99_24370 [Planctomycetaceae bacterium]
MPLAEGVSIKATAWGSQVLGYQIWRVAGLHGLQVLHGVLMGCIAFVLMSVIENRTRNWLASLLGLLIAGASAYHQICILRPQLAGMLCFTILLWLLERPAISQRGLISVAVLFVGWANLHPSFPAGLILILLYFFGSVPSEWNKSGSINETFRAERTQQILILLAVASLASCINPYGISLHFETITVSANPNLRDLLDWKPLRLGTRQGRNALLISLVVLPVLWRARRQIATTDLVVFVITGIATLLTSRMINWWAPITGLMFRTHVLQKPSVAHNAKPSNWPVRTIAACCILIAIAASSLPRAIRFREPASMRDVVSRATPIELAPRAIELTTSGLIWCPNTWGDYLTWLSHGTAPVFCTSHVHVVPRDVWLDYRAISTGEHDCLEVLDQRGITTVLVGRRRQRLIKRLRESASWQLVESSTRANIFQRAPRIKKGLP